MFLKISLLILLVLILGYSNEMDTITSPKMRIKFKHSRLVFDISADKENAIIQNTPDDTDVERQWFYLESLEPAIYRIRNVQSGKYITAQEATNTLIENEPTL